MKKSLIALAFGTLGLGIAEFVMMGILPDVAKEVDIEINVKGGGVMGQASAARSAIAKSLVLYSKDVKAKQALVAYDRLLLVDDVRRVESKKPLGTKARKKKQKSKR